MSVIELSISKEVAAQTEDSDTYTPANGVTVQVLLFAGSSPHDANTIVKLVWDWDGAGEEILWAIEGQHTAPRRFSIMGDGTKKLAVALDNGLTDPVTMSGYARVEVPD